MPTLLSRSKHKEFESNSTSYIRDQEERRTENRRKMKQGEMEQCWKFRYAGIFAIIAKITVHSENFNFLYD